MKLKLALLSLVFGMTLSAHAQSTTTQGQFNWSVIGFATVGSGTLACQPGPGILFPSCALPSPSLGVLYDVLLPTVGFKAPLTCTVATGTLPSWAVLSSTGTSCEIKGTPMSTAVSAFTLNVAGS